MILQKLRTLRSVDAELALLACEAAVLSTLVSAGFALSGVSRTQTYLKWWAFRQRNRTVDDQFWIIYAQRAQRQVKRVTGRGGSCLVRSFVLWALLCKRGVKTDLRIGFRKNGENIEGHAWIEYKGIPLNEDPGVTATYSISETPYDFDARRIKD